MDSPEDLTSRGNDMRHKMGTESEQQERSPGGRKSNGTGAPEAWDLPAAIFDHRHLSLVKEAFEWITWAINVNDDRLMVPQESTQSKPFTNDYSVMLKAADRKKYFFFKVHFMLLRAPLNGHCQTIWIVNISLYFRSMLLTIFFNTFYYVWKIFQNQHKAWP